MMLSVVHNALRKGVPKYAKSLSRTRQRCYGSGSPGVSDITGIPLSQPVSWLPTAKYAEVTDKLSTTHITTLDNGMKVASEEKFGNFCTVGILIDSGSRYEAAYQSGMTHFLEKLAFSSTSKYPDRDAILQKLEEHGGICDCQGSRDTLIYAVSANTSGLDEVVDLLSEVTIQPNITSDQLEAARAGIGFELETLSMRPDPEPLLVEMMHAAAYSNNTLGLPKICPEENIQLVDRPALYRFMHNYHTPDRMVLAGVGMKHDTLVEYAKKYFQDSQPVWEKDPSLIDSKRGVDLSVSQYTGGVIQVEKDLSNVSLGPNPMPELAHCVIGLDGCSHEDPDFVNFCVLNMIMGGGGSFSAGGPGKGMYTRLYINVLNRHHWMHNAMAHHHAYRDSGVFCIHASAHPSMMKDAVEVIARELVIIKDGIGKVELDRAKTQLQSVLLMNLESRPVVFEDIGRQVLASGKRLSSQYFYDKIGNVTETDIIRIAKRMLSSKVSVACFGDTSYMPSIDDIQAALISNDGKIPRRFSLFK